MAENRFRKIIGRLSNAISTCLIAVSTRLNENCLITKELHGKMLNGRDINSTKAAQLVDALQNSIGTAANPETRLQEICEVLKSIGERSITEIVNELDAVSMVQPNGSHTTTPAKSGENVLSIEDADKVYTVLNKAMFGPTNWENLGLKLGLLIPRLNVIGESGDAYRHLRRTIEAWLMGEDNAKSRTWQTLIDAVRETGDRAAAERIPEKMKSLYNIIL